MSAFDAAHMSNAKWRKAIAALEQAGLAGEPCLWKFVDAVEPYKGSLPLSSELNESGVGDCGAANGPCEFKSVEWLEIPHELRWRPYPNAPERSRRLPTRAGKAALEAAGEFKLVETSDGLRIVGYE